MDAQPQTAPNPLSGVIALVGMPTEVESQIRIHYSGRRLESVGALAEAAGADAAVMWIDGPAAWEAALAWAAANPRPRKIGLVAHTYQPDPFSARRARRVGLEAVVPATPGVLPTLLRDQHWWTPAGALPEPDEPDEDAAPAPRGRRGRRGRGAVPPSRALVPTEGVERRLTVVRPRIEPERVRRTARLALSLAAEVPHGVYEIAQEIGALVSALVSLAWRGGQLALYLAPLAAALYPVAVLWRATAPAWPARGLADVLRLALPGHPAWARPWGLVAGPALFVAACRAGNPVALAAVAVGVPLVVYLYVAAHTESCGGWSGTHTYWRQPEPLAERGSYLADAVTWPSPHPGWRPASPALWVRVGAEIAWELVWGVRRAYRHPLARWLLLGAGAVWIAAAWHASGAMLPTHH